MRHEQQELQLQDSYFTKCIIKINYIANIKWNQARALSFANKSEIQLAERLLFSLYPGLYLSKYQQGPSFLKLYQDKIHKM